MTSRFDVITRLVSCTDYNYNIFRLLEFGTAVLRITVCTLAVDGWAVTFGTMRMGLGGAAVRTDLLRCTKCNSPPINGQCRQAG